METNNTDTNAEKSNPVADAVTPIIESAINVGSVWAKYGLSIAKIALKTQSASFQHLSELLSKVADAIPAEKAEEAKPE